MIFPFCEKRIEKVHARDVIDRLIKSGCNDVNAFEWLMQLRLYWEEVS